MQSENFGSHWSWSSGSGATCVAPLSAGRCAGAQVAVPRDGVRAHVDGWPNRCNSNREAASLGLARTRNAVDLPISRMPVVACRNALIASEVEADAKRDLPQMYLQQFEIVVILV